jgi:hypothetical protein
MDLEKKKKSVTKNEEYSYALYVRLVSRAIILYRAQNYNMNDLFMPLYPALWRL